MADPLKKKSKTHTIYRLDSGEKVPGATTVLNVLDKPALIPWAWKLGMEGVDYRTYRDKAAEIGTLAHYMIECELKGIEPDLTDYAPFQIDLSENCLLSWYEWKKNHDIQVIFSEMPLVSELYRYGGTIDCYATVDGVKTIIDFKTGKGVYDSHVYQVAGYATLLEANGYPVEAIRILNIPRSNDETFQEKIVKDYYPAWKVFLSCVDVYYAQKEFKKEEKLA